MATLNIIGAELIRKYNAHACTDVTGFGVLGHANYLANAQKSNVTFVINRLPTFKSLIKIDKKVADFKFMEGNCPETSGGLLICLA
jgi:selenide,water dikinase